MARVPGAIVLERGHGICVLIRKGAVVISVDQPKQTPVVGRPPRYKQIPGVERALLLLVDAGNRGGK